MTEPANESLNAQFAALHAERVRTWDPAQLSKNLEQRQALIRDFDPAEVVQPGFRVSSFVLLNLEGGSIVLEDLIADAPVVLLFFRFANCPADNIALPYYQRQLWPTLAASGVRLVAVSPQTPERLHEIRDRHGLSFDIASDPDNRLAARFGITFVPSDTPSPPPAGWIGEVTGTGTWELPQTSVVIIDPDRTVRFVEVSPDWMHRTEAADILAALDPVEAKAAAA